MPSTRNLLFSLYVLSCGMALVWPVYAWLGARIEPMILGLPFSLAWVLGWVLLTLVVLVAYHATDPENS